MLHLRSLIPSYKLIPFSIVVLALLILKGLDAPTVWSQQAINRPTTQNAIGTVFTYQGRLTDSSGPVTGQYDFQFTLYDAESAGNGIGSAVTTPNVTVTAGVFTVQLDFGVNAFSGAPRWLAIGVRPAGVGNFDALTPRQPLTPVPYAMYAEHVNLHDHLGQTWGPSSHPLTITGAMNGRENAPLILKNTSSGSGLVVRSEGRSEGNGLNVENQSLSATIYAENKGAGDGVRVIVQAANALDLKSNGQASAILVENEGIGAGVDSTSTGGVGGRFSTATGINIIEGYTNTVGSPSNLRFRVTSTGDVNADGAFAGGGADFAELLAAQPGLEPGDVLVIGADGKLTHSVTANATHVAGVYSTKPGFLGGSGAEPEVSAAASTSDKIPLAIIGVVPVKVTAENGSIQPGDLLTTASVPGHAMKASPVNLAGIELYRPGTILGKALEPWSTGAGVIQVLIVLQ